MTGSAKLLVALVVMVSAARTFGQGPFIEITAHVTSGDPVGSQAELRWLFDTSVQPHLGGDLLYFDVLEVEGKAGAAVPGGALVMPNVFEPTAHAKPEHVAYSVLRFHPAQPREYHLIFSCFDSSGAYFYAELEVTKTFADFDVGAGLLPSDPYAYFPSAELSGRAIVVYRPYGEEVNYLSIVSRNADQTVFTAGIVILEIRALDALSLQGCNGADFDGNGILNVDDIEAFVVEFLGGCP